MTPAAVPQRALRSAVAVLVASVTGAAGHALAGGTVSLAAVIGCAAVLFGPAWMLAGRQRSWTAIAASQLAGQQLVHLVLGAAHDMTPGVITSPVPHDVMLVLHVAAAMVTAAWLRIGERRAWAVVRRVAAALLHLLTPWLRPVAGTAVVPAASRSGATVGVLQHVLVRRGPPLQA